MIKTSFIVFVSGLTCFIFSSLVTVAPPDPAGFSKLFVETIKKNNKDLYIKTFEMSDADFDWILKTCLANPYLSEEKKTDFKQEFGDLTKIHDKMNEQLTENFSAIQKWIQEDTININNIEFVDFYYDLEYDRRAPFYVLDNANLFIKHGTKYYKINMDDVVFVNNQWKFGDIDHIDEVDKYLDYISTYDDYAYAVDSTAAVVYDTTAAYAVDSAYAEPVYEEEYYDYDEPQLTEKQSKKVAKIQKKIDALYLQKDKIYYSEQ
ncbi:MAG: hypothetical protein ACTHJT_11970 [Cytophaga sp.]|uniref:hypothetical protein n=1 Tax=Cytophaga sp. TaxID=29535 RepID=UPI003F81D2C9